MLQIPVSDNLLLRTYTYEDATTLFRTIDKNRTHLRPWLAWVDHSIKEEHSLQFIQTAQVQMRQQTSLAMGIFSAGMLIGGIGMHGWDHQLQKAEVGYWLAKDRQGQGVMQQSVTAFINYLFGRLQLNKIEIRFHPANDRSAAVAKRQGFKIEGILRDAQKRNGLLQDVVVAGLLRKEWFTATRVD